MTSFMQFLILGFGAGAAYTLLAQGLILIHRGSGVVNFAHGALAMVGAYLFYELHQVHGVNGLLSVVLAVGLVALLGAGIYQLVMRPLIKGSSLARIIATLGLMIVIQGVCTLIWGEVPQSVNSLLPTDVVRMGGVSASVDRFVLLGVAVAVTVVMWALMRYSRVGLALRGNAENSMAVSTLGWAPNTLGTATWMIGGGLAALAGLLIAPLTGVGPGQTPFLVIPALAATLVARFRSFPTVLVTSLVIGMFQSLASKYLDTAGLIEALPFLVILLVLMVTKPESSGRRHVAERLPRLGSGRQRPVTILVSIAVGVALLLRLPEELVYAATLSLAWAIVLLSVVLLLGYAGQLSLAQFALAGIAALVAGRVTNDLGAPFIMAMTVGVLVTIPIGLLFAVPALRTKGASLAVVTLGLAVTCSAMVFNNPTWTGGFSGTPVGYPEIFGFEIDATGFPRRYALVTLAFFVLAALLVTNIRRGEAGRRLIAVRTNERAASALGINVYRAKLYAFAVSAGIAAVGGILLGFRNPFILYSDFVPFSSILAVAFAVVGGVGYVMGAFTGSTLVGAGIGAWLMEAIAPDANPVWLSIIGGLMVTVFVVLNPDGMTDDQLRIIDTVRKRLPVRRRLPSPVVEVDPVDHDRVPPLAMKVSGLSVKYGGVPALSNVGLVIRPGEVIGLIGPNGAGKTTFIDAVTGFVPQARGQVLLGEQDISAWPVHRRSRAGISRSFQSLELFESSSVRENLRVAAEPSGALPYIRDMVWPSRHQPAGTALAAVRLLGLADLLDTEVSDLSYGQRRLVSIARAISAAPSVLLLDEPAAGLSGTETQSLGKVVRLLADEWGIAILVIEHDMSFVMEVCDRLEVLDFGRQIGSGTPMEVSKQPPVIAAYLGAPVDEAVASSNQPHKSLAPTGEGVSS